MASNRESPAIEGERHRRPRRGRWLLVACLAAAAASWVFLWTSRPSLPRATSGGGAAEVVIDAKLEARVRRFCGDCHGLPRPENYSRPAWRKEVLRGFEFYARSGRTDLDPPPIDQTIAYYQSRAPAELQFPRPEAASHELDVEFVVERFPAGRNVNFPPAISYLGWHRLDPRKTPVLLVCDLRQGFVAQLDLANRAKTPRLLAQLHHPCHAEPCDLDGDQAVDLVVADLGGLAGADFDLGRVIWLRRREGQDGYEETVIASGLGRVSDARPADMDGDGDLDIIVAEFGNTRGRILLLRNVAGEGQEPRFETEELDLRPGTVHVPIHDLNGDGRPDFVALISQEFEAVDAFLNLGEGRFRQLPLWEAGDPAFGSSGLELIDIDRDGDQDILCSNGDSFDEKYVKPCHGVQWLENLGELRFRHHRLTDLPGTYRALAGDVDLDGDIDVVATVWVEPKVRFGNPGVKRWVSLVCLEQTSPGVFERHDLETDFPWHSTLEMADFDDDGDLDLALGSHSRTPTRQLPYWLAVWWNQARK